MEMEGAQALRDEAESQFMLGRLYAAGGRTSELARRKAAICYFNAAHLGHSRAQLCLALAYEQGDGIEQDTGKALHWAAVAADQSLAEAEFVVGCFYAVGVGIVPN